MPESSSDKKPELKPYDTSSRQLTKALARISELEKENMELKADLKRFGELGKVLGEDIG